METLYSLKQQKTLAMKIVRTAKETGRSIQRHSSQKQIQGRNTYLEKLNPIESIASISAHRRSLSKMYKSRLLPSQFLSTPAEVIKKLTQKVYTYKKTKDKSEKLISEIDIEEKPELIAEPKSQRQLLDKKNSVNSHVYLDNTCQKMLDDNKKSRKILKIASQLLSKRALIAGIVANNALESDEKANYDDFHKKLKDAHSQLVNKDRIRPKERVKKRESILKSFN
ncbi:hypothetical protein SteCoe_35293 [Stentor coeruleus]|uniref:Uncharacterized protein n=1 Tax=Stentor coeruleus TaxID=5963 RepID=A0A1R2ASS9_9CILI|nr:hypothetical protein SteCoe_35293 [Stentor coeruleus]